jgi:ELWxxDGT repeat protein
VGSYPDLDGSLLDGLTNVAGTLSSLFAVGDRLYFTVSSSTTPLTGIGTELWASDGTEQGTILVEDLRPGLASSSPYGFSHVNGTFYFGANDGVHGNELWRVDDDGGVTMVEDLALGSADPPRGRRALRARSRS